MVNILPAPVAMGRELAMLDASRGTRCENPFPRGTCERELFALGYYNERRDFNDAVNAMKGAKA